MVLTCLFGCNRGTEAIIVVDDQWAVKQARADCQSRARDGAPPCTSDPVVLIRDFEAQISSAFQIAPACAGTTLLTLNSSANPSALNSRDTWWLFPELLRSNVPEGLRYTVARHHDPQTPGSERGQGQPDSIMRGICSFVRQGGTIE